MRKSILAVFVLAALASAPFAMAQTWTDGFESYAVGLLPPQGGWQDFGGTQPIRVSTLQARTGTKSMRLSEGTGTVGTVGGYGSDVYLNFPGGIFNSGQATFSFWQYIEQAVDSVSFMYISTGALPATFQTGLDLRADVPNINGFGSSLLVAQDDPVTGNPTLQANPVPVVLGRWAEHRMEVDLDTNSYDYSYDGVPLVTNGQWDTTPGDGVTLGGLNFWMQQGNTNGTNSSVFFDDFSLRVVPEPASGLLGLLGFLGLGALRRR